MDLDTIKIWADSFDDINLSSPKLGHIYNPLQYAWAPAALYLARFGATTPRDIFMLGINPGPWGMAQSGVPFGDVHSVKNWMGISAHVDQPPTTHPKKPIKGFDLTRREGSGKRLWGWAQSHFPDAQDFFEHAFVWSYCPLLLLEKESARNLTPDRLIKTDRDKLYLQCDQMLRAWIDVLAPKFAIGIGAFATKRLQKVLGTQTNIQIGQILHPSPASPLANHDWAGTIEAQSLEFGLNWADIYKV